MRRKNTTKQMTKMYIADSLLLLMQERCYADITIAEITEKAGVNRSTYYRNFASKEGIVRCYFEQIMDAYLAEYQSIADNSLIVQKTPCPSFELYPIKTTFTTFCHRQNSLIVQKTPCPSFELYLNTIFTHFHKYKPQLLALYRDGLSYLLLEVLNRFFERRQPGKLKQAQEQFKLAYHIGGIYNFFMLWFSHGMEEPPAELTQIAVAMFPHDAQPQLV